MKLCYLKQKLFIPTCLKKMKNYAATIEGRGFVMKIEGKSNKIGFVTVRHIKSKSIDDVPLKALSLIKSEDKFQSLLATENVDLRILKIVEWEGQVPEIKFGYTFYIDQTNTNE